MTGSDWTLVGSPLDSSASLRGEEDAPEALRSVGLVSAIALEDAGDAHPPIGRGFRDPLTGIMAIDDVRTASIQLGEHIDGIYSRGRRPFVVGGDCALLIGALAAAINHVGRLGLVMVDGHVDCWDGQTSAVGQVAAMPLAIATGHGESSLRNIAQRDPAIHPEDAIVLGHNVDDRDEAVDVDRADPRIQLVSARALLRGPAGDVGRAVAERLASTCDAFWVHLDVDVFDRRAMPAVSYPRTEGLHWTHVLELLRPLCTNPRLLGFSIACFVPRLDASKVNAKALVELLTAAFDR